MTMKIPITMCHGVNPKREPPLDAEHFEAYFRMAAELGFQSISYDELAAWRAGRAGLPERPIMFDFDHPALSIHTAIFPIMEKFGFRGNLFINTKPMEEIYAGNLQEDQNRQWMAWEEIGELMAAGWLIGAHTHSHPNLSELSTADPTGEQLREELIRCDEILNRELGIRPRDFAFTGTSWSSAAEQEVKKRYRFGRLWIVGAVYQADGHPIRYAELAGVEGEDEADGGPPFAARYITGDSNPYRLPSMELERLIYEYSAYRHYLEGALEPSRRGEGGDR